MFNRILIGTDFSHNSRAALSAGIAIAARCLAHVEMVHVISYLEDIYRVSRFIVPDADWHKELLLQMEDFFPNKLYPNSERQILVCNSVSDAMLKHAREQNADMIVVGTRGRNALLELLMGSVAQRIARNSEIPVMIVRDEKQGRAYHGFNKILVAMDFSPASVKAISFATSFANFLKADLHVVNVIDEPDMEDARSNYALTGAEIPESCELNVNQAMQQLIPQTLTQTVRLATLAGEPCARLLDYSERNLIDFVVVGAHGHKTLQRVFLGSTAASVIATSRIPVITVSD